MNRVVLCGRLTADPEIRWTQGADPMEVARYTLAVDAPQGRDGAKETDFIRCVAFRRSAEFAEKYMYKGQRMLVEGRWKTGSYDDRQTGKKVYTSECYVDHQEFADGRPEYRDNAGRGSGRVPPAGLAANVGTPQERRQMPQYQQQEMNLGQGGQTGPHGTYIPVDEGFVNVEDGVFDDSLPMPFG